MKAVLTFLLSSLLAGSAWAGTFSAYTRTNTASDPDLVLLDSSTGGGLFTTRTITKSNLLARVPQTFDLPYSQQDNAAWAAYHAQAFADSLAFVEPWNNLSNWTSANVVVSNNFVYAAGTGNPSGANHSFVVGSGDEARIIAQITAPTTLGTNNSAVVWIGVGTNTPGAAPVSGDGDSVGIGLNVNAVFGGIASNTTPFFWNKGGSFANATNRLTPGTYIVEISMDTNSVSFVIMDAAHTIEYSTNVSRASIGPINNVHFWLSDGAALAGLGIGPVSARLAYESSPVRTGIEGVENVITTTLGSDIARYWLPPQYDSRTPLPLLLVCHGRGWDGTFPWSGQTLGGTNGWPERQFFQSLLTNTPCIIASSDLGGNIWGNQTAVNAVSNLLTFSRQHFSVSSVFVLGMSMGGLTGLNFTAQHHAEVNGFIGLYSVTSLRSMTNIYWTDITNSYPAIISSGYDVATQGFDPLVNAPAKFWRVPMRFYHNLSDGFVLPTSNAIPFLAAITNMSSESTLVTNNDTSHGTPGNYNAPDVTAFIQRITGSLPNKYPSNAGPVFPKVTVTGAATVGSLSRASGSTNGNYLKSGPAGLVVDTNTVPCGDLTGTLSVGVIPQDGTGITNTAGKLAVGTNVMTYTGGANVSGSNTFTSAQGLTNLNNTISGNGAGLTNLQANALSHGSQVFSTSGTNFAVNFGTNGVTAPVYINVLLTNNLFFSFTNSAGPGAVCYVVAGVGATNYSVYLPTALALFNTNLISSISGTNSVVVVTNGHRGLFNFLSDTNSNPALSNIIATINLN